MARWCRDRDLIGQTWVSPVLDVMNATDRPFVIERGLLQINGRQYPMSDQDDEDSRTAMPYSAVRATLNWNFPEQLHTVFGGEALMTLDVRLGTENKQLRVRFERR
jgi:hypothetical protein